MIFLNIRHFNNTCSTARIVGKPILASNMLKVRKQIYSEFKGLGVIIDSNARFNAHNSTIVARASSRANLIIKCFITKDVQTLVRAFKTSVRSRPILAYASWQLHMVICHSADILHIESVQCRFTIDYLVLNICVT